MENSHNRPDSRGRPQKYPGIEVTAVTLKLPADAHRQAKRAAQIEGVSMSHWLETRLWAAIGAKPQITA